MNASHISNSTQCPIVYYYEHDPLSKRKSTKTQTNKRK